MASSLQRTGVILVAQGETGFLRAMNNSRKAVLSFEGSAQKAAKGGLPGLSMGSLVVANVVGNILTGALRAGSQAVIGFGSDLLNSAAQVQTMRLSLENLVAMEIKQAGAADNMTQAFEMAVGPASALWEQIKELSLASPFNVEDVNKVFQLQRAYGQASSTALQTTGAILNFGAAVGATNQVLQRLGFNFAQIGLQGRIMQKDLRELANSGLNLAGVLRDSLGMSIEEVNAAWAAGSLEFQDIVDSLTNFVEENVGDAAFRMSRTFEGLKNTFSDLMFFASEDMLGGALGMVTDHMAQLLERAIDFVQSGALQEIGVVFEALTHGVLRFATIGESTVSNLFSSWEGSFSNMAINAFEWGANIILQMAEGMIAGATAVLQALSYIGNLITTWLAPGSPPKLLPDLPLWGSNVVNQFLHGFSMADFGLVKAIQKPIKSALSIMVSAGKITSQKSGSLFASLSESLIGGTATGKFNGFLSMLKGSLGKIGGEIASLTKMQIDLAKAVELVTSAEKRLEAARKKQVSTQKEVDKLTREYNQLLLDGADSATLAAKLAGINVAEEAQAAATAEAQAAQTSLDAAKDSLKPVEEKVKLQEELVNQMLELARAQAQAQQAAALGAAGGPGAFTPPLMDLSGLSFDPAAIDKTVEGLRNRLIGIIDQLFEDVKKAFTDSDIVSAIGDFLENWQTPIEEFGKFFKHWYGLFLAGWEIIKANVRAAVDALTPRIEDLLEAITNFAIESGISLDDVKKFMTAMFVVVYSVFTFLLGIVVAVIGGIIGAITAWIDATADGATLLETIYAIILGFIEGFVLAGIAFFSSFLESVGTTFGAMLVITVKKFREWITGIRTKFTEIITAVEEWATDFVGKIGQWALDTEAKINDWIADVDESFNTWQAGINATLEAWVLDSTQKFVDWIADIIEKITTWTTDVSTLFTDWVTDVVDAIVGFATDSETEFVSWDTMIRAIFDLFISEILADWIDFFFDMALEVTRNYSIFYSKGRSLMIGLKNGIQSGVDLVLGVLRTALKKAIELMAKIMEIGSPSRLFERFGEWTMEGFAQGIEKGPAPAQAIEKAVTPVIGTGAMLAAQSGAVYNQTMDMSMSNSVSTPADIEMIRIMVQNVMAETFAGGS